MQIALAVPTYNQAGLLRAFLAAWRENGADLIPLIVVDDGSDDETPMVLKEAAHPRLTAHRLPHVSAAHARNHALRHAPTPWLAFTDTDCRLSRTYFEILAAIPSRYAGAVAVEGPVRPVPGPKPPFTHSLHNPGGTYATANMVFRVEEVLALGGFDEGFAANYREDTDLALTLLDRDIAIPFCADLVVEHPHLPRGFWRSLRAAYRTQARVVGSEIRLYRKHPSSYSRVRHHRDARATLADWCVKYFALYLKECFRYSFREPGLGARDRLRAVSLSLQAMIVALAEQACIVRLCMVKWGEIARLKGQ
jgi:glycosyltransferase involved in cell wall biosynthesis